MRIAPERRDLVDALSGARLRDRDLIKGERFTDNIESRIPGGLESAIQPSRGGMVERFIAAVLKIEKVPGRERVT